MGRGGDLAKWLCRSELHQKKKKSKYLVEPFPHFGPHFFFSFKILFWSFAWWLLLLPFIWVGVVGV